VTSVFTYVGDGEFFSLGIREIPQQTRRKQQIDKGRITDQRKHEGQTSVSGISSRYTFGEGHQSRYCVSRPTGNVHEYNSHEIRHVKRSSEQFS
jgi:hypothetical protein